MNRGELTTKLGILKISLSRLWRILLYRIEFGFVKGRNSYISAILFCAFLIIIGVSCRIPKYEFLEFDSAEVTDVTNTLLANFIGVLSLSFAITAIVLSFIQIANKKYQVVDLLVSNTYLTFTFYFGLANIAVLTLARLLFLGEDRVFDDFILKRILNIEFYLFFLFVLFIGMVFYKVIKYINVDNLNSLFLKDIRRIVVAENSNTLLSERRHLVIRRSNEIVNSLYDSIRLNDVYFLDKSIDEIVFIARNYPESRFLIAIRFEIGKLFVKALEEKRYEVYQSLLRFWRQGFGDGRTS